MTVPVRPLHDRVLLRRVVVEENLPSGLVIPDTAKEKPRRGEVIAVGEGKINKDGTRQALDVKPGDQVLFGKFSGTEVIIDEEELLIMREDEILGVFNTAAKSKGSGR
jgi:chaperonin GroES